VKGAIEDFNHAIRINPKLILAYVNRGNILAQSGNVKGAIDDCNQALRLNPNLGEAYVNRGVALALSGDKKGAITDLQKASELFQQQRKIAEYQYTLKLIQQIKNR
jgi:tetratricopeptide (TPR) repeat protein